MSADYWGPLCWRMLHSISYSAKKKLSKNEIIEYYNFYTKIIPEIIPCQTCRNHWNENIKKPKFFPKLKGREPMINWIIKIHNLVNYENNKRLYSRKEVDNIYLNQNHDQDIYKFLLFTRKLVQYKEIDQKYYNLCLAFVSKYLSIRCKIS